MLYKDKYRVESTRLKNWDYSMPGGYYVTICVKNRERYFGKIENDTVILSDMGKIADAIWQKIPLYIPFVKLDEYIIMPNHIHGILIRKKIYSYKKMGDIKGIVKNNPMLNPTSLSYIIRWYKGRVTHEIRRSLDTTYCIYFAWQSRFYEHIIRSEKDLNRVRNYIRSNPANWDNDEENT